MCSFKKPDSVHHGSTVVSRRPLAFGGGRRRIGRACRSHFSDRANLTSATGLTYCQSMPATLQRGTPNAERQTPNGARWVTGKVGEWLQGTDQNGDPIVFSFTTTSSPFRTLAAIERAPNLSIVAEPHSIGSKQKTGLAVQEMANACGFAADCNYRITILNSPPAGKGLGSSSVDIASALLAIKHHRNLDVSDATLFQIMCRVERSDFLFRPELIIATNPVAGTFSIAGTAPHCVLVAWDTAPEERIDTEAVHHLDAARRHFSREYQDLCSLMQMHDPTALFHASTRSAKLNDQLLPKRGFSVATRLTDDFHALGLIAAHTGTYLGLVFPSSADEELLRKVRAKLAKELSVEPLVFQAGAEPGPHRF
jgi:L-threonine kinase